MKVFFTCVDRLVWRRIAVVCYIRRYKFVASKELDCLNSLDFWPFHL